MALLLVGASVVGVCVLAVTAVVVARSFGAGEGGAELVSAEGDVTISSCGAGSALGFFVANLDVVNPGPEESSYLIVVSFDTDDGRTHLSETMASVRVRPGQPPTSGRSPPGNRPPTPPTSAGSPAPGASPSPEGRRLRRRTSPW